MKNIVVALDFSDSSSILLDHAIDMARMYDAKVWLVHVAAPDPDFVGYGVGPVYVREDRATTLKVEHRTLDEYKKKLLSKGVDADALLIQGPTAGTLLDELDKLEADLLIIGKKGHSAFYKAFVGSVFTEVIKHAEIPVLAIPAKE